MPLCLIKFLLHFLFEKTRTVWVVSYKVMIDRLFTISIFFLKRTRMGCVVSYKVMIDYSHRNTFIYLCFSFFCLFWFTPLLNDFLFVAIEFDWNLFQLIFLYFVYWFHSFTSSYIFKNGVYYVLNLFSASIG
jgi:hypothetical protein